MKNRLSIACIAFALSGCSGVRFSDVKLNAALPANFKNRTLYPDTAIVRFKLPELAGSILYMQQGSGVFTRGNRIVKSGYTAVLEVVKDDDKLIYSSKIDRGASAQGSYLVFAAGFDAKQTADVDISDTSLVFINAADVPWDALRTEALKTPPPNTRRFWVQAALLTAITINNCVEISANASGVVGSTFGAKGKVYNKSGDTLHDYNIALELVDLDKLARSADGLREMPTDRKSSQDLLEHFRAEAMRIEKLSWQP